MNNKNIVKELQEYYSCESNVIEVQSVFGTSCYKRIDFTVWLRSGGIFGILEVNDVDDIKFIQISFNDSKKKPIMIKGEDIVNVVKHKRKLDIITTTDTISLKIA